MTIYRIRTRPHEGARWSTTNDGLITSKKWAEYRLSRLRRERASDQHRIESRTFVAHDQWKAAA